MNPNKQIYNPFLFLLSSLHAQDFGVFFKLKVSTLLLSHIEHKR